MLHAAIATYIICFAGGVTLIVASLFASRRLAIGAFRDFSLFFAASTLLMLVDALKAYERLLSTDFGTGLHVAGMILSVLGNFGVGWYLPSLALQIIRIRPSPRRAALHLFLAAALGVLGGMKEAAKLLWAQPGPFTVLGNVDYLALLGINLYAVGILLSGYERIQSPLLRSFGRGLLILVGAFALFAAAQLALRNMPYSPDLVHDYPVAWIAYYIGFVILALVYLARYFATPPEGTALEVPEGFVRRFGISRREKDIIEMMAKGFSNHAIAERLFISTLTVKNHVYHIYQKTGVGNKVQLLNMMNSSK